MAIIVHDDWDLSEKGEKDAQRHREKIDDAMAEQLAGDIAQKIQDQMEYPGQIKVTVIREVRAINFAK